MTYTPVHRHSHTLSYHIIKEGKETSIQLPLAANLYLTVLLFLLGACIGSFLTCAADRYERKESVLRGRSHCDGCGRALTALDLVPIFSYIFLGGRCRTCGEKIPPRCLFMETATGLLFAAVYTKFGFSFVTLETLLLFSALLLIALIDYDTMEIPDGILLFGAVCFAVFLYPHGDFAERAKEGLIGALVFGGGFLLISLLLDFVLRRESLGGGDVKLFPLLGLYTGLGVGLLTVILSCILGLFLFLLFKGGKTKEFPFGPAIAVAAISALLFGSDVINLYLTLF